MIRNCTKMLQELEEMLHYQPSIEDEDFKRDIQDRVIDLTSILKDLVIQVKRLEDKPAIREREPGWLADM